MKRFIQSVEELVEQLGDWSVKAIWDNGIERFVLCLILFVFGSAFNHIVNILNN